MDNVKLGSANVHDCLIVVTHTALFSCPPLFYLVNYTTLLIPYTLHTL